MRGLDTCFPFQVLRDAIIIIDFEVKWSLVGGGSITTPRYP